MVQQIGNGEAERLHFSWKVIVFYSGMWLLVDLRMCRHVLTGDLSFIVETSDFLEENRRTKSGEWNASRVVSV